MIENMNSIINSLVSHLLPAYPDKNRAAQVAWWLLQAITKKDKFELLSNPITLSDQQKKQLEQWIHEHIVEHKPLAYIIGWIPFGPLSIMVEPPLLIARPETEEWVINLIEQFAPLHNQPLKILDMCTGTGCIGLLLAHTFKQAQVYAVDINPQALEIAQRNAQHNNVNNITFIESDLFTQIPKELSFDLIVSNPPYIAHAAWQQLEPSVKNWEDQRALVAQHDGYELLYAIIKQAPLWIKNNNQLIDLNLPNVVLEIGYDQALATTQYMTHAGYTNVAYKKDSYGNDRLVLGRIKSVASKGTQKKSGNH